MRKPGYPDCITNFMLYRDLVESDYHLNGVGRAIRNVRLAAEALSETDDQALADYHSYAGASAARTAVDSIASWVNVWSGLRRPPSAATDLGNKKFRKEVDQRIPPSMLPYLEQLNDIAINQIDVHRQRAQHREGLALVYYQPPGEWYLAPQGIQRPRNQDIPLVQLLTHWADQIEKSVCCVLEEATTR